MVVRFFGVFFVVFCQRSPSPGVPAANRDAATPSTPARTQRLVPGFAETGRADDAGVSPPFPGLPGEAAPEAAAPATSHRPPPHGENEGRGVAERPPLRPPPRAGRCAGGGRGGAAPLAGVGGPSTGGEGGGGGAAGGPAEELWGGGGGGGRRGKAEPAAGSGSGSGGKVLVPGSGRSRWVWDAAG